MKEKKKRINIFVLVAEERVRQEQQAGRWGRTAHRHADAQAGPAQRGGGERGAGAQARGTGAR